MEDMLFSKGQLLDQTQAENHRIQGELSVAIEKCEKIQEKADVLGRRVAELETIEHSRVWRMTKPVRYLLDMLKKLFSEGGLHENRL